MIDSSNEKTIKRKTKMIDLAEQISELQNENKRLREALTPTAETKAAYLGEFVFDIDLINEENEQYSHKCYVPWTTIKEIMAVILSRANKNIPISKSSDYLAAIEDAAKIAEISSDAGKGGFGIYEGDREIAENCAKIAAAIRYLAKHELQSKKKE